MTLMEIMQVIISAILVSFSDDGNIVAIGAVGDDYAGTDSGSVSIFQYSNDSWSQARFNH